MNSKKVIIVGKRSNLSEQLSKYIKNSIIIKTNDIKTLKNILVSNTNICIIYNSCINSNNIKSTTDPLIYTNYSISYLSVFIQCCLENIVNIESIIFTSSSAIYGDNENAVENDSYKITNLYSSLKVSSELLLKQYLGSLPVRLIITRVFNMYGGNDHFSVINTITKSLINGDEFKLYNKGKSIRDFIYINDICQIYKNIIYSNFEGNINICSGDGLSINDLMKYAEEIFENKLKIKGFESNEISTSIGCTDKLRKEFGKLTYYPVKEYFKLLKN